MRISLKPGKQWAKAGWLVSYGAVSGMVLGSITLMASPLVTRATEVLYYDYDAFGLIVDPDPPPNSPSAPTERSTSSEAIPQEAARPLHQEAPQLTRLEINLSRRQLALYQNDNRIKTYPIAVGREGWRTPVGTFEVRQMIHNPAWTNPFTGDVIAGGSPTNPLGNYWIGFWTDGHNWVGMHGTPNPESVGRAVSHGCIRLYNDDIQEVFAMVTQGLPVVVVP